MKPKILKSADSLTVAFLGDIYSILVSGDDTGGRYAWFEAVIGSGNGPPPHRHADEDEAFYILEGSLDFMIAGRATPVCPGTALHVPRGVVHAFKNNSERPARILVQIMPAGFEKLLAAYGQPASPDSSPEPPTQEEIRRLLTIAPKFGIQIVPVLPRRDTSSA